jgi:tetratricopeptide (TPR) repeat protein
VAEYPNVPAYRYDLARVHAALYGCLKAAKKVAEAEQHLRQAVDVWTGLAADYPDMANYQRHLGLAAMTLGDSLAASGQSAEALRQYDQAVAAFSRDAELEARSRAALLRRGAAYVERGEWDKASEDFLKAAQLEPGDAGCWYWHALTRLGAGDAPGYRSACAAMLQRFGKTEDAPAAEWAAWACAPAPDAVADLGPSVELAEKALASGASDSDTVSLQLRQLGDVDGSGGAPTALDKQNFNKRLNGVATGLPDRAFDLNASGGEPNAVDKQIMNQLLNGIAIP